MAQGFKPPRKTASSSSSKGKGKGKASAPKKGARVIPPKKAAAVKQAGVKRAQTASVLSQVEKEMVRRAANGPLTIMKGKGEAPEGKATEKEKEKGKGKK